MRPATLSKKDFIQTVYSLLSREGIDAVSIRRVSSEMGCNSANIYRLFGGLDELLAYASLGYLQGYLAEVHRHHQSDQSSLELHFAIWECFARYSFANPVIFDNLFFGRYSSRLDQIMQEYYDLFPEDMKGMDGYLITVFRSGDFNYRDYLLISRCVADGYLAGEDAKLLNTVCINMYKGYLKELLDHPRELDGRMQLKDEFLSCLRRVILRYKIEGSASE